MNMKNIVAFDVETTGTDSSNDVIIQLAAVKFDKDFNRLDSYCCYVKPMEDFEIAPGALEKHGLTKEFILENGISSNEVMGVFDAFCKDCDLLSYNGNTFDIKFIVKEMKAAGIEFSLDRVFYDSMKLETLLHPRRLEVIYKNYTGRDLDDAHNALADVNATIEVFRHQLNKFSEQNVTLDEIMGFEESQIFDVDGMFKKEDDKIIFTKGKYRGVEFMEVAKGDPGYIKWYMNNSDFSNHTKNIIRNYYITNRKANA
jgi:DNA polymerase-3 subunit epsilon